MLYNGRLAGAVLRGEICQPIAGRGCEDGHRLAAAAGDGYHRCHFGGRFSGDEGKDVPCGREERVRSERTRVSTLS